MKTEQTITKKEVVDLVKESTLSNIKFAITDIDGVMRGKLISKEKFLQSMDDGIGFCNVIFGWDINDACYDNSEISGWHTGYPDAVATFDLGTLRKNPMEENRLFFIADFEQSESLSGVCPRTLLKNIVAQFHKMGYSPKIGTEFEWFNFREIPRSLKEKGYINPEPIYPGMFGYSILRSSQYNEYIADLFEQLCSFNIPLEGLHTETGDGVYEACIKYGDVLSAADKAILFKTMVKTIASEHIVTASFMAKWNKQLPGCSGHLHQSLWNKDGTKNMFYDDSKEYGISSLMESYLAGQLDCLPHILPLYAPTTNSYKRFVEGSWAPTTVSWGIENRTTAFRIINQSENSTRIENRVPGADANPYLTIAASLASGLYGIKKKMKLSMPQTSGNAYTDKDTAQLPSNLHQATAAMKNSEIANKLFGESFVDHFIKTREWEWRQYDPQQTNWELKRYFEII